MSARPQPLAHPVTEALACEPIGRAAIRALYRELAAYPKPGLVSMVDSGSHTDMDASTFVRSLLALRGYFGVIAAAGGSGARFCALQALGQDAEARMLAATRGANTHRGAIFSLGLLAAAAGWLLSSGQPLSGRALGETVRKRWGQAILDAREQAPLSHGGLVAERYGEGGARAEAAAGFPHLLDVGLPALRAALTRTADREAASVHCFFSVMAVLSDTNLLYRGGPAGLRYAQAAARRFLAEGGVERADWRESAAAVHGDFVVRRLSPGGSADLLAATLLVHEIARV
jgi:triphosphoribosyl-dephospho-CoA synthase